jgi:TDG/mug DNA glycosylase family protein
MDRRTVDVYETAAVGYERKRRAREPERARALAGAAGDEMRCDLGCGPGLYLDLLGEPVVAVDAARAMLAQARRRSPNALVAQADIERLPLRPGALGGVWASKSLQHIAHARLPMALAGVHQTLRVGGRLDLTVFTGHGTTRSDDDLAGRLFAWWTPEDLTDVLVGAGFRVDQMAAVPDPEGDPHVPLIASATRLRTLADTVGPKMRLLCCGLNPSVYSADAGRAFARPGNRFWPALLTAGLVPDDHRNPHRLLRTSGIGLTDIVKRASAGAAELSSHEYHHGLARIERLCERLQPAAVCFVGLAGWRSAVDRSAAAGWQERRLGPTPAYVMPSTSGRNARTPLADLAAHLRAAVGPSLRSQR